MGQELTRIAEVAPTETALTLPDGLGEDEWEEIGSALGRLDRAKCWWIGDWINYGEDAGYVSREKYDRAERLTGLARKTLQNYAATCRAWESSLRREDLSFWKHTLPEHARLVEAASAVGCQSYEVTTERQRQIADKAARRVYDGLSTMQGYCSALEEVRPERAIAGAHNGDIAAWDDMATKAIASLTRFRRAIRKGAINGNGR